MATTGPTTAPLPQYSWLEPTVPGAILEMDTPATKPRWLDPGAPGTVLTITSSGLPAWMVPPPTEGVPTTVLQNKGDLITAAGPLTAARLASGQDRYVLASDSTSPTGLAWSFRPVDVFWEGPTAPSDPTIEMWINPAEDPTGSGGMTNPMSSAGDLIVGGVGGLPGRLGIGANAQVLTLAAGLPTWASVPVDPGFANPLTTAGDLMVGASGGAPSRLGIGSNGNVLTLVSGMPAWSAPTGGGMTNPMTAVGDLIIGGTSGTATRLAAATNTQVLTLVGGSPAWAAPAVGGGGMTNPMTTLGDLVVGAASGVPGRLGIGTTNQVLTVVGGVPAWAAAATIPTFTQGSVIFAGAGGALAQKPTHFIWDDAGNNLLLGGATATGTGATSVLAIGYSFNVPTSVASPVATIQLYNGNAGILGSPGSNTGLCILDSNNITTVIGGGGIGANAVGVTIPDTYLLREATQVWSMRNANTGTTPAILRLYNTYANAGVNCERASLGWASNVFTIASEALGTGGNRALTLTSAAALNLGSSGATKWSLAVTTGHLVPAATATYDIGTAALKVRDLYMSGAITAANATWTGRVIFSAPVTLTYATSIPLDASLGNDFIVTATDAVGFTIPSPSAAVTGQRLTVRIRNGTAGALGALTWGTAYKLAAWTQPATATSRTITFAYNGANWVEVSRTTADVPN